MGFGTPPGVAKHTELTDKEVAGVIDHADESVTTLKVKDLNITDPKLASGVGLSDGQICKLPTAVADQILKRGAAAWEVGAAPVPAFEGDYSDYSIYDTFVDEDSYSNYRRQDAVFNQEETVALILDAVMEKAKTYTIATKTLGAVLASKISYVIGGRYNIGLNRKSAYGTYAVVLGYSTAYDDCDKVYVFKDGVLIKTLEDSDLGISNNKIFAAAISPKGKYIMVSGYITAESDMGWVVLVGS